MPDRNKCQRRDYENGLMQYCAREEADCHKRQRNGDVDSSFVRPIGMRAVQQHAKNGYRANASKNQADSQIVDPKERLNDQGRPKGITIKSRRNEKEDDTKQPHRAVGQCFQNQVLRRTGLSLSR